MRILILTLLFSPVFLGAFQWESVDVDFSLAWQHNAQITTGAVGKSSDLLLSNVGASVFADFDDKPGGFYIRPGGWLSLTTEEVFNGISRPTGEANISHMKILGLMADMPIGYVINAGKVDIGIQTGLSFYLRFPVSEAQEGTADSEQFWLAYYGKAQFLYINLSSWVAVDVSETLDLVTGLRMHQPMGNFWTDAPFFHGTMLGVFISLRFDIRPKTDSPLAE